MKNSGWKSEIEIHRGKDTVILEKATKKCLSNVTIHGSISNP